MTRNDSDALARLTAVNRSLKTVQQNIDELLRWAVQRHDTEELHGSDLRTVGHRLVSMAGDLTTLGVDLARWADESDDVTDTEG